MEVAAASLASQKSPKLCLTDCHGPAATAFLLRENARNGSRKYKESRRDSRTLLKAGRKISSNLANVVRIAGTIDPDNKMYLDLKGLGGGLARERQDYEKI